MTSSAMTARTAAATPLRRIVAVIAFLAMLAGFAVWIAANLAEASTLQARFETRLELLSALKDRPVAALTSGGEAVGEGAIIAPSDSIAASVFQRRIVATIEEAGARLQSVQVESDPDGAVNGLDKLSAQLSFEGSIGELQNVLFALETGVPYCFVESLAVRPATLQQANAGAGGGTLRVTLAVAGFWMAGEGQ